MYERINRIKANAPGLRTMLSLGGAETAAHDFLQMAGTAESRYKCVQKPSSRSQGARALLVPAKVSTSAPKLLKQDLEPSDQPRSWPQS